MKAWTAHDQDTTLQCCRTLHVKHAAYVSALYTLASTVLRYLPYQHGLYALRRRQRHRVSQKER